MKNRKKFIIRVYTCLLILVLVCIGYPVYGQQTVHVTGRTNPKYVEFSLSQAIHRLLFIKTKGNVVLPDRGYVLDLDKDTAERMGIKTLVYIPLDGSSYFDLKDKELSLDLVQLSVNNTIIYYSVSDKHVGRTAITKEFFRSPSLKDTLFNNEVTYSQDMRFTKEWIEMLDGPKEVFVESLVCMKTKDGGYTRSYYSPERMGDLARQKLHYVSNLFKETSKDWSKKEWKNWLDTLLSTKETPQAKCNDEVWSLPWYFNPNYIYSTRYGTDKTSDRIGIIELLPSHESYKKQQFTFFDLEQGKYYRFDLHTEDQPFYEAVNSFVFHNEKLYILTESMKWVNFVYDKSKKTFVPKEVKALLPDDFFGERVQLEIVKSYYNERVYYALFTTDKYDLSKYYIASFETMTGDLVAVKHLSELIGDTDIQYSKELEVRDFKYANSDQDYFVLLLRNRKKEEGFLLKIQSDLEDTKAIQSVQKLDWYEYILTTDTEIVHVRNDRGVLQRYFYANDLSSFKNTVETKFKGNLNLVMNDYLVKDGHDIRLITGYRGKYENGFKQIKINLYGDKFVETCAYFYLPLEELNSGNEKKLMYMSKNSKGSYTVFMKDNDGMRYVNVR